jgi:hypothetical protein
VALRVRGFVRAGAAIAACTLIAACTPEPPVENPPTPSASTPTASPTSTESEIERQMRLDYEVAEKAYRTNMAEQDRQSGLGTAKQTRVLEMTSTGNYLRFAMMGLREIKSRDWRIKGSTRIAGVSRTGWQEKKIHLTACEDGSTTRILDQTGKDITPADGSRKYVQRLTLIKIDRRWKLSDIESKPVQSFEGAICA